MDEKAHRGLFSDAGPSRQDKFLPIVGLGASAVMPASVLRFFEHAGTLADVCFVLVLRHCEAIDMEAFKAELTAASGLPCEAPEDGQRPAISRIYIAPPNIKLSMRRGLFRVSVAQQLPGERATIDSFLVVLAEQPDVEAVGVIFAETGDDGTLGVVALKENDKLAIAEARNAPVDSAAASMARDPAALADLVMLPQEMPARIAAHFKLAGRMRASQDFDSLVEEVGPQLTRIATVLRNQTGHDFHGYKRNAFLRRVQRRIHVTQTGNIDDYLEYLRSTPGEAQGLFNDLLIGVTHFFRDRKEFEFLEREIVAKLFEGKAAGDQLRVWVLGCATGEEAYSIAILLREHMAKLDSVPHVQIFATDIDGRALAQARVGRYGEAAVRYMTLGRLARWFLKEGDTYYVVKELREMCIFSQHNIIKDAPFSRLDLISCRNLLIYLSAELQNRVVPLFHFALRQGGYLFLGSSENVTRHSKLFAPMDRRYRIFQQQENAARRLPEFPLTVTTERRPLRDDAVAMRNVLASASLGKQVGRVMERYAPACMIIDENYDVLHFIGRTGQYIDPPTGAASLHLPSLIHRDLRMDLRTLLHRAESADAPVRVSGLKIGRNGHFAIITMTTERLETGPDQPRRFAVILQEGIMPCDPEEGIAALTDSSSLGRHANIERLESELRLTRDRLQATIEELESTNEELKASNEEYQSVNEELQSVNEELETSKEELQSLNEELHTINGELAQRVEELGRANSDLKNLFESTQLATVFLDNHLRVKSFTPAITELFHLIESDLGRPISHIAPRVAYEDLESDVRKVLRTLVTIEREIRNPQTGSCHLTRVLPYRSIDNVIEGVVITFLDVTLLSRTEEQLRESEGRLRIMVEGMPQMVWRSQRQGHWTWSSPQWSSFTGQTAAAAMDLGWLQVIHPEDRKAVQAVWSRAEADGGFEIGHRLWHAPQGDYRNVHTRGVPLRNETGSTLEWLGTCTDVHELLLLQQKQKILLAELQHRVRNSLAVIRSIARRSALTSDSVEDYAANLDGRIRALARAQSMLTRAPDALVDMENMLRDEILSHGIDNQVSIKGPNVMLAGKAAEDLSLVFHELTTNSIKYGALYDGGSIAVLWSVAPRGQHSQLEICWSERTYKQIPTPTRRGFGTELIEKLVPHELNGIASLEYSASGVLCVILLPLSASIMLGTEEDAN